MSNFKKASRAKLRFATNKGMLSTEDLWDLSLESLDSIAKAVNRQLKAEEEESFIAKKSKASAQLQLMLEILKEVIKDKQDERTARTKKAVDNERLRLLRELRDKKDIEKLNGMSAEELDAAIKELEESEE